MNDFQKIMQRQNKTAIEVMNIAAHELAVENMSPEDYDTWEQGEKLRDAELARITAERDALFQIAVKATRAVDEMPNILKPRAAELDHALATLEPELWERVDAAALKQSS